MKHLMERSARYSRIAAVSAACLAAVFVAACGDDDDGGKKESANKKKANVAFITYAYTDYSQAQEKGMKAGLAKAGGGTVKVFVSNFDPSLQTKQCQDAITSGRYNAIILATTIGPSAAPCAEAAKAAGVPLFGIDGPLGPDDNLVDPQIDGVVGQVAIPLNEATQHQVDAVKAACEGIDPCEIIAELSDASDPVTSKPLEEIERQLPNTKVVSKFTSRYDPALVVKAMPDQLAANPGADVFLSAADSSAVAAIPIIKEAGMAGKIKIIAYGGSVLGAKAVKDGEIFLTLGQFPQTAGSILGEMASKAVNGEKIEDPGVDHNDIGSPILITKDTVDQFTPQWGATTGQ